MGLYEDRADVVCWHKVVYIGGQVHLLAKWKQPTNTEELKCMCGALEHIFRKSVVVFKFVDSLVSTDGENFNQKKKLFNLILCNHKRSNK